MEFFDTFRFMGTASAVIAVGALGLTAVGLDPARATEQQDAERQFTFHRQVTGAPVPTDTIIGQGKKVAIPQEGLTVMYRPSAGPVVRSLTMRSASTSVQCPMQIDSDGRASKDAQGRYALTCDGAIPEGAYTLSYTEYEGASVQLADTYYFYDPSITPRVVAQPLLIQQGERAGITGSQFFPDTDVEVSVPGVLATTRVRVDREGSFELAFPIGAQTPVGAHPVQVQDLSTVRPDPPGIQVGILPTSNNLGLTLSEVSSDGFTGTLSGAEFATSLPALNMYLLVGGQYRALEPGTIPLTDGKFEPVGIRTRGPSFPMNTEYRIVGFEPGADPTRAPSSALASVAFFVPAPKLVPVNPPRPPVSEEKPRVNQGIFVPERGPRGVVGVGSTPHRGPMGGNDRPVPVPLQHRMTAGLEPISFGSEMIRNQWVPDLNAANEFAENESARALTPPSGSELQADSDRQQNTQSLGSVGASADRGFPWGAVLLSGATLLLGLLLGVLVARKRSPNNVAST